jgi:hypothetical protein
MPMTSSSSWMRVADPPQDTTTRIPT